MNLNELNKKKILVFAATYNEAGNISELINSIFNHNNNVHILFIDDNSPDNTSNIIEEFKKKFNRINLIIRKEKLGLDTAHKEAYNYAIEKNFDYLITMDADLSHDPKEINNFINNLNDYPFVIGSRYIEGGKCEMTGLRLFLSYFGNKFIKFILKSKCSEFTTSYRGFNLKKLKNFNLNIVENVGYSFFMCVVFELERENFDIKEIPITFYERSSGISKIPKKEILRTLKNLFLNWIKKYLKK
jgi:dolichol-phosphate mannosyltransferase|tara:strand:+ start:2490 stop:3221 length:732 start_codon:yes stop_codon:yes gene_type:complete